MTQQEVDDFYDKLQSNPYSYVEFKSYEDDRWIQVTIMPDISEDLSRWKISTPEKYKDFNIYEVIINKADSYGEEERWIEWFNCPNCKSEGEINKYHKHCPICGIKIKFAEDVLNEDC